MGFCNFSHVQHFQLFPRFLVLNAGLFPMSCYLQLSRLPVKGLPWLLLLFLLGPKNKEIKTERKNLFFFFFLFSAKGERVTPTSTKAERVTEIFGKAEIETKSLPPPFLCL